VHPLPGHRARLEFIEPQRSVSPGQAAVCYVGDRVIGGGWIERTEIVPSDVFPKREHAAA
jgi:tRNA-specific 2-thiouridylase